LSASDDTGKKKVRKFMETVQRVVYAYKQFCNEYERSLLCSLQAVSMFSAALQSGQLGPVVQQFEVGSEAVNAANQGDLEEFVRALQKSNRGNESPKDDEKME